MASTSSPPPSPPPPLPPAVPPGPSVLPEDNKTMMYLKCTIKALTAAGLVLAFAKGSRYVLDRYADDHNKVIELVQKAVIPSFCATGAIVKDILPGCFNILVEIRSLDALYGIWNSYIDGNMKKKLEKVIVTDELRSLAPDDAVNVELSLEISEGDYRKSRNYLLESALRNYVEACKSPSTTSEETSTITRQVKDIGICVIDPYKYKSKSISFKPGKIEWKVVKELLTKATNLPVIRVNRITLEISDPIYAIAHALVETSADLNVKDTQGKTLLIYSAKMGAKKAVRILVNAGADVNVTDERGRAPLIYAVETGSLEVVDILKKAGADANETDVTGKTSLIYAAQAGKKRIAQSLVEAGTDVNVTDARKKTPLMYAVETGRLEVVDILINAGADLNVTDARKKTPLMYAVETGSLEVVDILIKAGADVNMIDARGKTSLVLAAEAGMEKLMQSLVDADANVNVRNGKGKAALMYAVETGSIEFVDILKKAGADVELTDEEGKTALMYAAAAGNEEIAQVLVKADADANVRDAEGMTALMYAVKIDSANQRDVDKRWHAHQRRPEYIKLVEVLLKAGADVKMSDAEGKTALMHASKPKEFVQHPYVDDKTSLTAKMVNILIEAGAHVNAKDAKGKTALVHAAAAGNEDIVKLLLKADAEVNMRDTEEMTALLYAVKTESAHHQDVDKRWHAHRKRPEYIKLVEVLLKAGAEVNVRDTEGKTALMHAVKAYIDCHQDGDVPLHEHQTRLGDIEMVEALLKAGADINMGDAEEKTALMYASKLPKFLRYSDMYDVRDWATKVVKILIKAGADAKLKDAEGKTALIHASESKNKDVVQFLEFADSGDYVAYGQSASKGSLPGFLKGEETGRQDMFYQTRKRRRTKVFKQKTELTSSYPESDPESDPETGRPKVRKKTAGPTIFHQEKERHQVEAAKEFIYDPGSACLQDDKVEKN